MNTVQVSLCHMACQVGKGVGGVEEVTFLYRLKPGACPKSYGVNVARLAGRVPFYHCFSLIMELTLAFKVQKYGHGQYSCYLWMPQTI